MSGSSLALQPSSDRSTPPSCLFIDLSVSGPGRPKGQESVQPCWSPVLITHVHTVLYLAVFSKKIINCLLASVRPGVQIPVPSKKRKRKKEKN
jgi:hypothetical protein